MFIIILSLELSGKFLCDIYFKNCTVTHGETILFQPDWGIFNMAVGKKVVSAFSGPADVNSFDLISHTPSSKTIKSKKTPTRLELETLYHSVRNFRNGIDTNLSLSNIFHEIKLNHAHDWLLPLEIAEILSKNADNELMQEVLIYLEKLKENRPALLNLINNGLELIFEKEMV